MKRIFLPLVVTAVLLSIISAKAFYDPSIGRWVNRDPLGDIASPVNKIYLDGDVGEMLEGPNLYAFVRNNPVDNADPFGLACGSGWNDVIFPDKAPGFDFTKPCQNHDNCYDNCANSKKSCDDTFCKELKNECKKAPWWAKADCYSSSKTFCLGVKALGGSAYENAQKNCKCPKHGPTHPKP